MEILISNSSDKPIYEQICIKIFGKDHTDCSVKEGIGVVWSSVIGYARKK